MKRILLMVMAVLMITVLFSCKKDKNDTTESTQTTTAPDSSETTTGGDDTTAQGEKISDILNNVIASQVYGSTATENAIIGALKKMTLTVSDMQYTDGNETVEKIVLSNGKCYINIPSSANSTSKYYIIENFSNIGKMIYTGNTQSSKEFLSLGELDVLKSDYMDLTDLQALLTTSAVAFPQITEQDVTSAGDGVWSLSSRYLQAVIEAVYKMAGKEYSTILSKGFDDFTNSFIITVKDGAISKIEIDLEITVDTKQTVSVDIEFANSLMSKITVAANLDYSKLNARYNTTASTEGNQVLATNFTINFGYSGSLLSTFAITGSYKYADSQSEDYVDATIKLNADLSKVATANATILDINVDLKEFGKTTVVEIDATTGDTAGVGTLIKNYTQTVKGLKTINTVNAELDFTQAQLPAFPPEVTTYFSQISNLVKNEAEITTYEARLVEAIKVWARAQIDDTSKTLDAEKSMYFTDSKYGIKYIATVNFDLAQKTSTVSIRYSAEVSADELKYYAQADYKDGIVTIIKEASTVNLDVKKATYKTLLQEYITTQHFSNQKVVKALAVYDSATDFRFLLTINSYEMTDKGLVSDITVDAVSEAEYQKNLSTYSFDYAVGIPSSSTLFVNTPSLKDQMETKYFTAVNNYVKDLNTAGTTVCDTIVIYDEANKVYLQFKFGNYTASSTDYITMTRIERYSDLYTCSATVSSTGTLDVTHAKFESYNNKYIPCAKAYIAANPDNYLNKIYVYDAESEYYIMISIDAAGSASLECIKENIFKSEATNELTYSVAHAEDNILVIDKVSPYDSYLAMVKTYNATSTVAVPAEFYIYDTAANYFCFIKNGEEITVEFKEMSDYTDTYRTQSYVADVKNSALDFGLEIYRETYKNMVRNYATTAENVPGTFYIYDTELNCFVTVTYNSTNTSVTITAATEFTQNEVQYRDANPVATVNDGVIDRMTYPLTTAIKIIFDSADYSKYTTIILLDNANNQYIKATNGATVTVERLAISEFTADEINIRFNNAVGIYADYEISGMEKANKDIIADAARLVANTPDIKSTLYLNDVEVGKYYSVDMSTFEVKIEGTSDEFTAGEAGFAKFVSVGTYADGVVTLK